MTSIAAAALACSFASSFTTNVLVGYQVGKCDGEGGVGACLVMGPMVGSPVGAVGTVGQASLFLYQSGLTVKSAACALAGGVLAVPLLAGGVFAGSIVGGLVGIKIGNLFYKE